MNYYGVRTIERFIAELEAFFKIKLIENKLEKYLKKKNVSCYKLLTYDLIFWIVSLIITVYFLKDYIEEYLDNIYSNLSV
jgi:hypothetical protein|tara:strand:+ start:442 stop:681 length:240 start_codon:yes stop_codon:yes gene_type:complete